MNMSDLKAQLLLAIESSDMQVMFPNFCDAFREMIERTEPTESDADIINLFIEIFKNPDEWLAFMAERAPQYLSK